MEKGGLLPVSRNNGKAEESRNVSGEDISKYIKAIKYWIWYIKRCKKESDSFLR